MSIQSNFPAISPSLLLDFANVQQLDPRITFTRASTATYYGTQTAKAEENLLLQSQDFTTTWANVASSDTANTTVAPDGTTTADTILETATTNSHRVQQEVTLVVGQTYTVSVFAKQVLDREFQIAFATSDVSGNPRANFDLTNGTLGTVNSELTATITASTNGFYRCAVTFTAADSLFIPCFSVITEPTAVRFESYAGDITKGVILWGAQLEARSAATAYTPTTTQSITNYIPVLETAASGVARFDHNPTTFESLGLLIEESRSNLVLQSETFSTTWAATRSSIGINTFIAPSGAQTADTLIDTTDNDTHFVSQSVTTTAVAITFSVYAKAAGQNFVTLTINDSGNVARTTFYNLSTGAVGTTGTGITASVVSVGNGWYRCIATVGTALAGSNPCVIGTASADNTASYAGNGFSGVAIWGAQVEIGAFPTSYVATVASQVTRASDVAVMTGTNFSSWYNQAEGTLYAEWNSVGSLSDSRIVYAFSNGTFTNVNYLTAATASASNQSVDTIRSSNTSQATIAIAGAYTNYAYRKTAAVYKVNDFALSGDGGAVFVDTSGLVPVGVDRLALGTSWVATTNFLGGTIKKVAYYPLRVTNAQLQALTS